MARHPRPGNITFLPAGETVIAHEGDTLLDAALDHGLDLPHECGGNCTCTTCHVVIREGAESLSPMEPPEHERLKETDRRTRASRLACQALLIRGDVVAEVVGE